MNDDEKPVGPLPDRVVHEAVRRDEPAYRIAGDIHGALSTHELRCPLVAVSGRSAKQAWPLPARRPFELRRRTALDKAIA